MYGNVSFSKKGRAVSVVGTKILCRREVPDRCFECGEQMYLEDRDDIRAYEVLTYGCRNGHSREILIDKEV